VIRSNGTLMFTELPLSCLIIFTNEQLPSPCTKWQGRVSSIVGDRLLCCVPLKHQISNIGSPNFPLYDALSLFHKRACDIVRKTLVHWKPYSNIIFQRVDVALLGINLWRDQYSWRIHREEWDVEVESKSNSLFPSDIAETLRARFPEQYGFCRLMYRQPLWVCNNVIKCKFPDIRVFPSTGDIVRVAQVRLGDSFGIDLVFTELCMNVQEAIVMLWRTAPSPTPLPRPQPTHGSRWMRDRSSNCRNRGKGLSAIWHRREWKCL